MQARSALVPRVPSGRLGTPLALAFALALAGSWMATAPALAQTGGDNTLRIVSATAQGDSELLIWIEGSAAAYAGAEDVVGGADDGSFELPLNWTPLEYLGPTGNVLLEGAVTVTGPPEGPVVITPALGEFSIGLRFRAHCDLAAPGQNSFPLAIRGLKGWEEIGWVQTGRLNCNEREALLPYEGVLRTSGGDPLVGEHEFDFTVYMENSSGTAVAIWTETQTLQVTAGRFAAELGAVTPFNVRSDRDLWLGVSVDGGAELTPRQRLGSSAFALSSGGSTTEAPSDVNRIQFIEWAGASDTAALTSGDWTTILDTRPIAVEAPAGYVVIPQWIEMEADYTYTCSNCNGQNEETALAIEVGGHPTLRFRIAPGSGRITFVGTPGGNGPYQTDGTAQNFAIGLPPTKPLQEVVLGPGWRAKLDPLDPAFNFSARLFNAEIRYYFRFEPEPRRMGVNLFGRP